MNSILINLDSIWWSIFFIGPIYSVLEYFSPLKIYPKNKKWWLNLYDLSWEALDYCSHIFFGFIFLYYLNFLKYLNFKYPFLSQFSISNFIQFHHFHFENFYFQLLVIFLLKDFLSYLAHRIFHLNFLWSFHILHHSSKGLNWFSLGRANLFESYITEFFIGLILSLFLIDEKIILITGVLTTQFSFLIHSNVKFSTPLWLNRINIFNSPLAHHWHHAVHCEFPGGQNFGVVLIIWDKLFGTYYIGDELPPKEYGIMQSDFNQNYPKNYVRRLFFPFEIIIKKIKIFIDSK